MKQKIAALCLVICLVCTSCGTKNPQEPDTKQQVTEDQETKEKEEVQTVEGAVPCITYTDYSKEVTQEETKIPLLKVKENCPLIELEGNEEAQNRMNRVFEQQRVKNQSQIDSSIQTAESVLGSRTEEEPEPWKPYSYEYTYETRYASARLLSIKAVRADQTKDTEEYQDIFGCSYTFYVPEGKLLTLSDIFADDKGAKAIVEQYIRDKVNSGAYAEYLMDDYESYVSDVLKEDVFYLDKEGLVVICNPYLLTEYGSGIIEVRIPYEALEGVMNETYLP